jgi:Ca-activated chloride channel family protein
MIFDSPLWLLGLLALPAVALLEAWIAARDRERTARLVARGLWARVVRRPHARWRPIRLALLLLGIAGIVLALARPQWGIVREKVEREGVDVVLVLDTSGSMAVEDVPPNRFFLARHALEALVERLEGDRFALVAFEGEAYPLSPLTLDADALGLFLDTMEPGIVPSPGTSLGVGIARGLDLFVDKDRRNKVMVLVSDGEDLEGELEEAIQRAKEAGAVVHAVGVGTEAGQPVPDFDAEGRRTGFKHDPSGAVVISRLDMANLEAVARGTGGRAFRLTPTDPGLSALAAAIEGMERRSLAREFSYRRKERFQIPLAAGLGALALGLLLPLPPLRLRRATPGLLLVLLAPGAVRAAGAADELLLRPTRLTEEARKLYASGDHPKALATFEQAARARPDDLRGRFNLADALYKNGKLDEAAALYRSLGEDARSPLAGPARFNLGNALYGKKDFKGAIGAYRDALRVAPGDLDTRKNLELALRALQEQQQQQQQQQQQDDKKDEKKKEPKPGEQGPKDQKQPQPQPQKPEQAKTPEERENERFQQQAGMPKERAMQLLQALQQNEKEQQRKQLREKRAAKKGGKDW